YFLNLSNVQNGANFRQQQLGANAANPMSGLNLKDSNDPAVQRQIAAQLANRLNVGAVDSAATGASLGDFFQYAIDHPVSLARQKSAMLPIVGKEVEGARVSIYNQAVQAKHPLLGLRLKPTSALDL